MARHIRDAMSTKESLMDDHRLVQFGPDTSLAEATAALGAKMKMWAIVMDEKERPVTLITAAELNKLAGPGDTPIGKFFSKLPPGVVVAAEARLNEFVQSREFTALDIGGAPGAIVFEKTPDDMRFAGVLTGESIDSFLIDEFQPVGETKGLAEPSLWSSLLAGDEILEPVIVHCEDFNHRNELPDYLPKNSPTCADPHPYPHPIWH